MRKNVFYLIMLICGISIFACHDDKDDKSIADELAGTYVGTIDVYSVNSSGEQGSQLGEQLKGQYIYMTAIAKDKLRLELKDFVFSGITIKSIAIDTQIGKDNQTLSGEADNIDVIAGIQATARVTGTVINKVADLEIHVIAPVLPNTPPIKMLVKFAGAKQE